MTDIHPYTCVVDDEHRLAPSPKPKSAFSFDQSFELAFMMEREMPNRFARFFQRIILGIHWRRCGDEPAPYANLRDGGNLPPKPYRWTDWHTAGLIVSMLILAVFAILGGW